MAKLKTNPITAADIEEFVKNDSDFGFEMEVLALLTQLGYECQHSGTYRDPVTDKMRQFDIRARKSNGDRVIGLAVECKNLRPNNPLLLSSLPRGRPEAFHNLFVRTAPMGIMEVQSVSSSNIYPPGEPVGKKTDQVARESNTNLLVSDDEVTFDRVNQATNSCADLVKEFGSPGGRFTGLVIPVLVIPNGRLWQADYDERGHVTSPPRQMERSTYFLNHPWTAPNPYGGVLTYKISHVEIMTLDALQRVSARFFGSTGAFS